MERLQYMVRATHPARAPFFEVISASPEAGPRGGFYVSHPGLGCGKTYDTAESAIRNILAEHAYSVVSLLPVQSAPVMVATAPEAASVKWQVDSHGVYRAVAGGRTVWVFRRAPGDWAYGTAEFGALDNGAEVSAEIVKGGRDIACTAGAARVYDAKRYALALAAALPANAKPLRVMHGGELRRLWVVQNGAVQFAAPAPTAPEIVANYRAAYPEIVKTWHGAADAAPPALPVADWVRGTAPGFIGENAPEGHRLCALESVADGGRGDGFAVLDMIECDSLTRLHEMAAELDLTIGAAVPFGGTIARLEYYAPKAKPAPAAYDDMPNAADSMWNDALPAEIVDSVNFQLARRGRGPMTDSEINRIHAPWKAGESSADALAEIVAADRRAAEAAAADTFESPEDDSAMNRPADWTEDDSGGADYTESDLAAWFAKVDSALAILDCPPTTRGEREAYPEAGLTDATAEDFALYLATEYRRPALAWLATYRTEDGTQPIWNDRGLPALYDTKAEAMAAACEAVASTRRADMFAGSARAVPAPPISGRAE